MSSKPSPNNPMHHQYPQRALLHGAETQLFELVSSGATPEQWAEWLRAPLEHAAARGDLVLVMTLLEAGASGKAGWEGCGGRALLDAAALGGNADVVSALLEAGAGPDVNVLAGSPRRSPLYHAVLGGHEDAARQLLLAGTDVNFVDPADHCGPLLAAARGGHTDLVRDLLIVGACPSPLAEHGRTPLHAAAANGHDEIVSLLLSTTADKNAVDNMVGSGYSPLMEASSAGHLSTVEIILAAGVDVNIRTENRTNSALDLAAEEGHVDVLKAILESGADVDAACPNGYTALHDAVIYGDTAAVGVLLGAGASVDVKTVYGRTPLSFAATIAFPEIARALLGQGAKVDEADEQGWTPLHHACQKQKERLAEVVDLLLRWGASETAEGTNGSIPADLLHRRSDGCECSADELECARLLARAPVDRSWRRRCWLVMLRSRATERENGAQRGGGGGGCGRMEGGGRRVLGDGESADGSGGGNDRKVNDAPTNGISRSGRGGGVSHEGVGTYMRIESLGRVVTALVGLDSHNLFRTIVGYL